MVWFTRDISAKHLEDLLKRIVTCEQRINGLEIENKMLRDKVLRKIQKLPDIENEEKSTLEAKNLKVFSPFM